VPEDKNSRRKDKDSSNWDPGFYFFRNLVPVIASLEVRIGGGSHQDADNYSDDPQNRQ
jgi:hypothetical protein